MKVRTLTTLAALATVSLLTAPAPALADPGDSADLAVQALGTHVAADEADARRNPFRFTVTNNGPDTAKDVVLEFDFAQLDQSKVGYVGPCAPAAKQKATCRIGPLAGHASLELTVPIYARGGQGPAGTLTATVRASTADPSKGNNAARVPVETGVRRFDLVAVAFDVYADDAEPPPEPVPIPAGGSATLDWFVVNASDRPRKGLVYSIQLPERVTFAEKVAGCEYSADNRAMTCADPAAGLKPTLGNTFHTGGTRIAVAGDAKGPVLAGGTITAYATEEGAAGGTDPNVKELTEAQRERAGEVMLDDPVARYAVHVGPAEESGILATLGISRLGSGLSIVLIGGLGLAVLAAGAVLFVASRRRRVVLVAPDEPAKS